MGATSRALVEELYRSEPTAGRRITSIVHNARSGPLIFFTEMSTSAHQIVMKRKMVIKGITVSIRPNFIVSMKDSLLCLWAFSVAQRGTRYILRRCRVAAPRNYRAVRRPVGEG